MLEGGSQKEHTRAKRLFLEEPALFNRLMEKLTVAVSEFLKMQIDAGADAVQIFDSLGGLLSDGQFESASAGWMRQIIAVLDNRVPVIVFSRGAHGHWQSLARTGAQVLGIDWTIPLKLIRNRLPADIGVQGNLDPFLLTTTPKIVARETARILREMRGAKGHIFNLGHGVPPDAKLEYIQALVETVREFK